MSCNNNRNMLIYYLGCIGNSKTNLENSASSSRAIHFEITQKSSTLSGKEMEIEYDLMNNITIKY
jgi:hypothetical protein